jgi:alginate O-acetyltransferase complex protein AlgI
MVFNSLEFVIFFLIFFLLYWFVFNRNNTIQNIFFLIGSYLFYSWWDWRFLALLVGSSLINYFLGIYIERTENEKRRSFLLYLGLIQGLGGLLFFKYYNFFIDSLIRGFSTFNISISIHSLKLILPLGISFYTFRAISYLLDIYNEKIKPTNDWVVFFSYIAFFPCLVAGPIDRANSLIPQLENNRTFNYGHATDGMRQILWGLFKKIVIADNCTTLTNSVFENYHKLPASSLLFGAFFFAIQVYADFSGYSDMAIGFSRLLGFKVTKNFNFPYFAQNISEFWQKWHISLTSWMTDYVFTPLAFVLRKSGKLGLILAIIINFILIGLWHGANWTFILFGFLQGCYFIPLILNGTMNKHREREGNNFLPSFREFIRMSGTFILVMLTVILFRSPTIGQAGSYYKSLLSTSLFSFPEIHVGMMIKMTTLMFIFIMIIVEWFQRTREHGLDIENIKSSFLRLSIYYSIIIAILFFSGEKVTFIYAQF